MKDITSNESLSIPEGVDIKIKSRVVTVTGPRGTLTKAVKHIQMDIQIVSIVRKPGEQQVGFEDTVGRAKAVSAADRRRDGDGGTAKQEKWECRRGGTEKMERRT
jgi:hypothetical protein